MKSIPLRAHEAAAYAASGETFQIRRVVKPQPVDAPEFVGGAKVQVSKSKLKSIEVSRYIAVGTPRVTYCCPYGAPGDRLALREAFWAKHEFGDAEYGFGPDLGPCLDLGKDFHPGIQYCASPEHMNPPTDGQPVCMDDTEGPGDWWLSPPDDYDGGDYRGHGTWVYLKWGAHSKLSAARMPLWAVRWHPVITAVRLERVQSASNIDFQRLGIVDESYQNPDDAWDQFYMRHEVPYRKQFDRDNPRTPWDSNPWVWVIDVEGVKA